LWFEFAAWRYGGVFRRRLQKRISILAGGTAVVLATGLFSAGAPIIGAAATLLALPFFQFGFDARKTRGLTIFGIKIIGQDGKPLYVSRDNLEHTTLAECGDSVSLELKHSYGRQRLTGDRAARALSTLLANINRGGGSANTIGDATEMISHAGDPARAIAVVSREAERRADGFEERAADFNRAPRAKTLRDAFVAQQARQRRLHGLERWSNLPPTNPGALHRLPGVYRLALEMALHESSEQFALDHELATLERDWREAEEIAAIADNLLT
jgi:hypothetical protein